MTDGPDQMQALRDAVERHLVRSLGDPPPTADEVDYGVARALEDLAGSTDPAAVDENRVRVVAEIAQRRLSASGNAPDLDTDEVKAFSAVMYQNLMAPTEPDSTTPQQLRGDLIDLAVTAENLMSAAITHHVIKMPSAREATNEDIDRINFLAGDILGRVALGEKVAIFRLVMQERDLAGLSPALSGRSLSRWVELRNIAAHHTINVGSTLVWQGAMQMMRRDPDAFYTHSRGRPFWNAETATEAVELFKSVREGVRLVYVAVLDAEFPDWNADGQTID